MKENSTNQISDNLFIKELIRKVHQELIDSQNERESNGMDPLFYVKDLTIEANFIVETEVNGGGGIRFGIVSINGGAKYNSHQVHKITLTLSTSDSRLAGGNDGGTGDGRQAEQSISPQTIAELASVGYLPSKSPIVVPGRSHA
jgi:hypothetical protein